MQNIQDAINMIAQITGDNTPDVKKLHQQELTTSEVIGIGTLMLVRLRGIGMEGTINCYYNGSPVLLIDQTNFDTGDIYLICDQIDAIGVASGAVTIEGYYY